MAGVFYYCDRRRFLTIITVVGMFSLVMNFFNGCARTPQEQTVTVTNANGEPKPEVDPATIEALIEKLAHPAGSKSAWRELRDLGPQAFPNVIDHLGDKGTSFTADAGSEDRTWTVGRACGDVLWCNLEPYNWLFFMNSVPERETQALIGWRPTYYGEFFNTPEAAKAWLATHRSKSVVDLQIEVLEWVTSHRSKRKFEISSSDRKQLLETLDTLKRTRKALPPAVPWAM
jgi:hypothetical protein